MHEDYELPVTTRLIIARRVPIYERAVTDVERRRTNSEGDIYNLRERRLGWDEAKFYFGGSQFQKDLEFPFSFENKYEICNHDIWIEEMSTTVT